MYLNVTALKTKLYFCNYDNSDIYFIIFLFHGMRYELQSIQDKMAPTDYLPTQAPFTAKSMDLGETSRIYSHLHLFDTFSQFETRLKMAGERLGALPSIFTAKHVPT